MAAKEDIYKLTFKADAKQLSAANAEIKQQLERTGQSMRTLGTRVQTAVKAIQRFVMTKPTLNGLGQAFKNIGTAALRATRTGITMMGRGLQGLAKRVAAARMGLQGLAKRVAVARMALQSFALGLTMVLGPIALIGGMLFRAIGGMEGLGKAMGAVEDSSGGAAGGLDDANDSMAESTDSMSAMGNAAEKTGEKVGGLLGAFGEVGAGFIQRQGRAAEEIEQQSGSAVAALAGVDTALANTESGMASSEGATTRLGKAWANISGIFQNALAKALLPLIEKLAEMLEDPRFIEFAELLAEDIAGALELVVTWIAEDVIPSVLELMDQINEAGGPVEFFKKKWEELKNKVLQIVAIVLGLLIQFSASVQQIFAEIGANLSGIWASLQLGAQIVFDNILEFAQSMWDSIKLTFQVGINFIIGALNALIMGYNRIGGKFGLPEVGSIPLVTLAKGGIVNSPLPAIVGDNPTSPEVVAPLGDLVGILRESLGGDVGGITINKMTVTVPPGTTNPQATGEAFGQAFIKGASDQLARLRQAGARLPV
jgi:hypothetical protein